jgi:hypothetical protein
MRYTGHEHYIRIEPTVGQLVMNISFARTKEISYIMNSKAYDIYLNNRSHSRRDMPRPELGLT